MSMLEDLKRQVAALFDDGAVPTELKVECRKTLAEIQTDLLSMDDDAERVRFIHEHIEREYDLAQADTDDQHDYDSDKHELRETALCTCNDPNCYLKQGRVPLVIQMADSFENGVQQFRQEHPGSPRVLDEAMGAWTDRQARVFNALLTVNISLRDRVPPSEVELDDKQREVYA